MARAPYAFGGLTGEFSDYRKARFAVLPVPYERTTSYMKGTSRGPGAIIDASRNMELYDEELDIIAAESGIATLKPLVVKGGPETMVAKVRAACKKILEDGKFPVVLGGEHSISPGVCYALADHYGEISVLQFDAHSDLRETYRGSRFSHACAMARMRERAGSVQVGIRSVGEDEAELVKELRGKKRLFLAKDVLSRDCIPDILGGLRGKVFITFDVDAFDHSMMPSTGTPEPGGLGWYDSLDVIRAVVGAKDVVGFDVMELCPMKKFHAPDFAIAKLTYKTMGYLASKKQV